jgi:hypothetical protein
MYRKNRNDFFIGKVKKNVAPPRLSSEELHDVVSECGDIVFGFLSVLKSAFSLRFYIIILHLKYH